MTTDTDIHRRNGAPAAADQITIERIRIQDGTTLPVARRGTPSAERPSIVLLHGITDSWRSFDEVIARLPDR